jgi:hypothetical protein
MGLEDERSLVKAVLAKNHVIGCYVGLLGETALRMTEGVAAEMEVLESRREKSACRGLQELQDAARPVIGLRTRIAPIIASRDRLQICLCTRANEGSLARSAGTVLCRTQGGRVGLGRVPRFPAFPSESVGHEGYRSPDRSGIVGASEYHDDDAIRPLRSQSRGEEHPGGASD